MSAGLGGTGLVADDLYLLAHHDVTGKPVLQPRPLGIGLAGALLAELMLGGGICLRPDGVVLPGRTWPGDELARHVRDLVAAEQEPHPVREWLLFLARPAATDVAGRLERSGYLTRAGGRIPWRPRPPSTAPCWRTAPEHPLPGRSADVQNGSRHQAQRGVTGAGPRPAGRASATCVGWSSRPK